MKNIYIAVIVAIVVVTGIIFLNHNNDIDYVVTVDDDVAKLEAELSAVEAQIAAGTLSTEQATVVKASILNRLDAINKSVNYSSINKLSDSQKEQLNDGLNRLKQVLITYQSTLSTVDEKADDAKVEAKLNEKRGGSHTKLSTVVISTIDTVEEAAEELISDYETDEVLDTQVDDVIAEENSDNENSYENEVGGLDTQVETEESEVIETDTETTIEDETELDQNTEVESTSTEATDETTM